MKLLLTDLYEQSHIDYMHNLYNSLLFKKTFFEFIDSTLQSIQDDIDEYEENDDYSIITDKIMSIKRIKLNIFLNFISSTVVYDNIPRKLTLTTSKKLYKELMNIDVISILDTCPVELKTAFDFYNNISQSNNNRFFAAYNFETFTAFFKKELTELFNWVHQENEPIIIYKYINMLIPSKIVTYMKKDIDLRYHTISYQQIKAKKNNYMNSMGVSPIDSIPYDPSNRRMTNLKTRNEDGSEYFSHTHIINEHERYVMLIAIPKSTKNIPLKQKLFNAFDTKIIANLMKLSDSDFFITRRVVCEFGDLVKLTATSANDRAYRDVRDSLLKIDSFKVRHENDDTGEFIPYDICKIKLVSKYSDKENINNDIITKTSYQKLIIHATFSEEYIDKLLKGSVFTDENSSYKLGMTEALLIPLQGERYKILGTGQYVVTLGYNSFFNTKLLLGKSSKSSNLSKIDASLNELMNNKQIIKNYSRKKDSFIVEFMSIDSNEKEKLIAALEDYEKKGLSLTLPFSLDY